MGIYLNPDNEKFRVIKSKDIYVDKSLYIEKIYQYAMRKNEYISMSRPRRFGKSTDAYMLAAYFSKGCNSASLFDDLNISNTSMYKDHLNQHNVIFINMQYFYDFSESVAEMIEILTEELIDEINQVYHVPLRRNKLPLLFTGIYRQTKDKFIFIIDEL
ncbi:MAG: AAA family ATPase [Erysipelotrichaceae bacterium]|nr:AAA family ATPase [Erysipelotrichaceae bacterium]